MGSQKNWRMGVDSDDYFRFMEKRLMHEERRPVIRDSTDLSGPGLGEFAQHTFDWNDPTVMVNGFWYSVASQVRNSPDDAAHWMGITEGNEDSEGIQRLREYKAASDATPIREYNRRFWVDVNGVQQWGAWQVAGGGTGGGGGAPTGPAGGDLTGTYPNPVIGNNKVTNAKILDGAVTTTKIADDSVTTSKIVNGTITDADVNALNKDGADATPSMRTLGSGTAQAAKGSHHHTLSHIDPGGTLTSPLVVSEIATPTTPASGAGAYYFKADGLPYALNDAGVEYPLIPAAQALHQNPSFDIYTGAPPRPSNWTFFWMGSAGTSQISTDPNNVVAGGASLLLTQTSDATGYSVVQSSVFDILPGAVVTFEFWAKTVNVGQQIRIEMLYAPPFTGNPDYYDDETIAVGSTIALTTAFKRYSVSWSIPAGMGSGRFALRSNSGSNGMMWVDETSSHMTSTGSGGASSGTANIEAYHTFASSSMSPLPTTMTQIPGMVVNIPVSGTAEKLLVVANFDGDWVSGTGGQMVASLYVDGVQSAGSGVFQQATSGRATVAQNYVVTGLSAGTHEFSFRAYSNTTLMQLFGSPTASHTRATIVKLLGPQAGKWYVQGIQYPDYQNVPFPVTGDMYLYGNSGDVFQYDGSAWVYSGWSIKGPPTALNVRDEGTPVNAAITTLNFRGSGVVATDGGGGVANIDITGGGGGGGPGGPMPTWTALCTTQTEVTGATVPITGASVVVPSLSVLDKFLVVGAAEMSWVSGNGPGTVGLWVGGTQVPGLIMSQGTGTSIMRNTPHQNWVVTGLAAGNHTFEMRGISAAGVTWRFNPTNTRINVVKLEGSTGPEGPPGTPGTNTVTVADEGTTLAAAASLNFKGAGVSSATAGAGNVEVTISGAPTGPAGGDLTGTYPNPSIGPGKIQSSNLAADSVHSDHIIDGTIVATNLADGAVTSAKILDATIALIDLAPALTDGTAGSKQVRALGTGATDAAAGNHGHSLTSGAELTGFLPTNKGGTNNSGPYSPGAVMYASNTNMLGNNAVGTAGQLLTSGGTGAPSWSTPTKALVGLGNVDNTSDLNKPISTATQTALDTKAPLVHTHTKAQITDFTHAASHQPGGSDPMQVDAPAATGSLRTLGATATQAAAGDHVHAGLAPMLDVKDENSLLTNAPTGFNFLGAGVAATGTTEIQVTVPGVPIGTVLMWPTATPPTGYLLCNGAAIPAGTEYDTLRTLLTAAPWSGLLPDFTGRGPLAPGASSVGSGTVRNLGGKHGSDEIAASQLPAHIHTAGTLVTNSTGNHLHTVSRRVSPGSAAGAATGNSSLDGDINTSTTGAHTHDVSGNTGSPTPAGGSPYLTPTLVVNFIIRAY